MALALLFGLATALANAAALITQHIASTRSPTPPRGIGLVAFLFRQPLWLAGWVALAGSLIFQTLALHFGPLALVQPLLVGELVLALLIRRLCLGQAISGRAWTAAGFTSLGLTGFLILASPSAGSEPSTSRWFWSGLLCLIIVGMALLVGWRGSPARRAAAFALATAVLWATEATLIETPIAAAIGAGLSVEEPVAAPIVMVGGGASETAIMSLGGIVTSRSVRIGGTHLDDAIAVALRHRYGVVVAPHVAESLKMELASPLGSRRREVRVVPARTVDRGLPVNVEVPGDIIEAAVNDNIRAIVRSVKECLGEAPPDLAHDVSVRGLSLVGGLARLEDFADLLAREVGVSCHVVDQPELAVIRGLVRCLNDMGSLHRALRKVDA